MKRSAAATGFLALTLLACAGDDITDPEVPADWRQVSQCQGRLGFLLPPDAMDLGAQPADSCAAGYEGPGIDLSFDYGGYTGIPDGPPSSPAEDFMTWDESVDGRIATFRTYRRPDWPRPFFTAVYVEEVDAGSATKLTFTSFGATLAERDQALIVFRSIDFTP